MRRNIFDEIHDEFRATARSFFERECVPNVEKWERDGKVSREAWLAAGEHGLIGWEFDEKYGGLGVKDFRFNQIVSEEMFLTGSVGIGLGVQNDILVPYLNELTTEDQKERWLPKFVAGEYIGSIAMSEPAAGSDLAGIKTSARDEGDHWVVNGQKTFISNGLLSKLVLTAVKTDPSARHKGISLLMIEDGMEGFTRGRELEKMGCKVQDTAELSFVDVRVPVENVLGDEGEAFGYLGHNLPQERLTVAVGSVVQARSAIAAAIEYTKDRKAFGQPVASFQNTKFELAACSTEVEAGQAMLDRAVELHVEGELSAADAARVKLFCTEMQARVVDRCLQLFGGYGYMMEYPIARLYTDARVARIYAGTSEVMKVIIAKSLGL